MIVLESAWSTATSFFVFIFGFFLINKVSCLLQKGNKVPLVLYFYHTFFCLVYLNFVIANGGDALSYFKHADAPLPDFGPGTPFLLYIVKGLKLLALDFLGVSLLFNIFGSIGLCFLYASLMSVIDKYSISIKKLIIIFLFLPSLSFWSSGLGKDAIAVMAVSMVLYSSLQLNKRFIWMVIGVALMLCVRPHMAGMIVIAVLISSITSKDVRLIPRVFIAAFGLVAAMIMIPFALQYAGVETDASNLDSYIETRQSYNQHGGGGVDITSMSLPMQMFTYVFRPLPFEVGSIPQLFASLDNMLILYICLIAVKVMLKSKRLKLAGNRTFMWSYVGISWCILAMTTANLGIAMRQKWMFVPILVYLLISILAEKESRSFK